MTEERLRELLRDMSLEEKVYQLVQLPGNYYEEQAVITGTEEEGRVSETIRCQAGSTLGVFGAEKVREIQDAYMAKQPHHIPLLFMLDVIHGFETVFPCPLGQGASFSPETSEACAAAAAREAAAAGVHVTFAPMADLVRDARWGRVMESPGEDPYLNGKMAAAMVRGFQGNEAGQKEKVAACIKHFAAYGAAVAGLDYSNVELSEHTLREYYLPAYRAAIDAGCELAMTSFNTWDGIPASANKWLMRKVLREEMGFEGVLISDWGALGELVVHGICADKREAARMGIEAGVDIDMCADAYALHLAELVRSGEVEERLVDESVWRVLSLKNKLGLFENPYKDASAALSGQVNFCSEHRALARKSVQETAVLLKNETVGKKPLLPLDTKEKIAFIGPYIEGQDLRSSWAFVGTGKENISIKAAAGEVFAPDQVTFSQGCTILDNRTVVNMSYYEEENWEEKNAALLAEALEAARNADTVVLCLGEHRNQSGEATSRAQIMLPDIQMQLLCKIAAVNENIVTVLFNGRPLDLREVTAYSKAILECWLPGTEGGHGILDVLTGAYNPSGRLSMSFPYCVGQAPICYNTYSSGRPRPAGTGAATSFTQRYLDVPNEPLYPFGFGLSYTRFAISPVALSQTKLTADGVITASVTVKNTGDRTGTEVLQLYIRDLLGSRIRPVKELKGFERVTLLPGEEKEVSFAITEEMLRFHTADGTIASEPGRFKLWIGDSSTTENEAAFELV